MPEGVVHAVDEYVRDGGGEGVEHRGLSLGVQKSLREVERVRVR